MIRLQAHFNPYPRDQLVADVLPNGEIDWQASWWNEITKLQQLTAAQEKENVGSDWYRYVCALWAFCTLGLED